MSLLRSSRKPSTRRSANIVRRPTFSYTGPKRPATDQPDGPQAASKQRTGDDGLSCLVIPKELAYMSDYAKELEHDENTIKLFIDENICPPELHGHILNIMTIARDTGYFPAPNPDPNPDPSAGETKSNAIQRIPRPLPSNGLKCLHNPQLLATLPTNINQLAQLMVAFDYLMIDPLIHLLGAAIAVKVMNGEDTAAGASKSQ